MPAVREPIKRNLAQTEGAFAPWGSLTPECESELGQRLKENTSVVLKPFDETMRKAIFRIAVMLVSDGNAYSFPKKRVSMYGALKGKVGMTSDFDARRGVMEFATNSQKVESPCLIRYKKPSLTSAAAC